MSTDEHPPRRRGNGRRRFARTLVGTLVALAVLAGGLAAAGAARGPRLVEASPDALLVSAQAGGSIAFTFGADIGTVAAERLLVTPAAEASAEADGNRLTVTFAGPLEYGREYTVSVPVSGGPLGGTTVVEHRFTTRDLDVHALERSPEGTDRVQRRSLADPEDRGVLFEASRIQEFAVIEGSVVAAVIEDDGSNSVVLDARNGTAPLALPGPGTVRALQTAEDAPLIGYLYTDGQHDDALAVHDLSGAAETGARLITAFGTPMPVTDWAFVPGTSSVVVQDAENSLFLIDVFGRAATVPLGRYAEMRGFVPGTGLLVVADPDHGATIDLSSGQVTVLDLPEGDLGADSYPRALALLSEDDYLVEVMTLQPALSGTGFRSELLHVARAGSTTVHAPATEGARIGGFCLSPNGRYVAVETVSPSGVPDGYPRQPGHSGTTTTVIDIATGLIRVSLGGAFPDWC